MRVVDRTHLLAFIDRDAVIRAEDRPLESGTPCIQVVVEDDDGGVALSLSPEQVKQLYVSLGDVLVAHAQARADAELGAQVVPAAEVAS